MNDAAFYELSRLFARYERVRLRTCNWWRHEILEGDCLPTLLKQLTPTSEESIIAAANCIRRRNNARLRHLAGKMQVDAIRHQIHSFLRQPSINESETS